MTPAISMREVTFGYEERPVLERIDIDILPQRLTVCLGRNGAGKSTLMRLLGGMISPRQGFIQLAGLDLNGMSLRERARKVGYLSQMHQPVFPFTVLDVVLTGRAGRVQFLPGRRDRDAALRMIALVGIDHLRDRNYTELSGGEQQMVMIARALAQEPEILLLDEPTSHLDFNNQVNLLSLLKKLVTEGLTVVAVLHDPNMSLLFGDDFLFVHESRVVRNEGGEPWNSPMLKRIYQGRIASLPYKDRAVIVPEID